MTHYRMHRGWMDHPILDDGEPYTKREAWLWLIEHANWKSGTVDVNGKPVAVKRGQACFSFRYLATAWGWTICRVQTFLNRLSNHSMISTDSSTGRLLITICNYSRYQADTADASTVANTRAVREQYESEEGKKDRRKSNRKDSCGVGERGAGETPTPEPAPILEFIEQQEAAEQAPVPPAPTAPTADNVVPLKPGKAPLPADWSLPDDYRALAVEVGHATPDLAARRFRNYWLQRAEDRKADAVKSAVGWKRAWENWIAKDVQEGKGHGQHGRQGHCEPGSYSRDVWARLASREAEGGFGR